MININDSGFKPPDSESTVNNTFVCFALYTMAGQMFHTESKEIITLKKYQVLSWIICAFLLVTESILANQYRLESWDS